MVVDPDPKNPREDVISYQVPENSRAHKLLVEMLDQNGYEHVKIESIPKKRGDTHGKAKEAKTL